MGVVTWSHSTDLGRYWESHSRNRIYIRWGGNGLHYRAREGEDGGYREGEEQGLSSGGQRYSGD
jgi:hypothetical protein